MRTIRLTVVSILISYGLFAFISCKREPCKPPADETRLIPEESSSKVPYKDFTKLTFLQVNTGDTHYFFMSKIRNETRYFKRTSDPCEKAYNLANKTWDFQSDTYKNRIVFSLVWVNPSELLFELNLTDHLCYIPNVSLRSPFDIDSIKIQNKWYKDVTYFKNEFNPERYDTSAGCYFNSSHGIIKLELPEGNLELLKIN